MPLAREDLDSNCVLSVCRREGALAGPFTLVNMEGVEDMVEL